MQGLDSRLRRVSASLGLLMAALSITTASPMAGPGATAAARPLRVLFLGDQGHHNPAGLNKILAPYFATQGIELTYTEKTGDLAPANLAAYDALFLYNNLDTVDIKSSGYIKDYVDGGKGLMVVHCGLAFSRNLLMLDTVFGARFVRHDTGVFRTKILLASHPAMKGVRTFLSWDETYEHRMIGDDKTLLMIRDTLNNSPQPYTWVRNQGKGRVYYTASGHDTRTWEQPNFQKQLAVGLYWAMKKDSAAALSANHREKKALPIWDEHAQARAMSILGRREALAIPARQWILPKR